MTATLSEKEILRLADQYPQIVARLPPVYKIAIEALQITHSHGCPPQTTADLEENPQAATLTPSACHTHKEAQNA